MFLYCFSRQPRGRSVGQMSAVQSNDGSGGSLMIDWQLHCTIMMDWQLHCTIMMDWQLHCTIMIDW